MLSQVFLEEIIVDNFQLLSAIGWQGYLLDSKGILLLSEFEANIKCAHWLIPVHSTDNNLIGVYVGERSAAFQTMFRGDWGLLSPLIAKYNPNKLSLVAFHNSQNNKFSIFCLEDSQLNPVNSYRVLQARLVEFFYS